jgi:hypothetical protein
MQAVIKGNTLTISVPLVANPELSKSSLARPEKPQNRVAASTGGFKLTELTYKGKPVRVSALAIIPA